MVKCCGGGGGGCSCVVEQGPGIEVIGSGSAANPYVVSQEGGGTLLDDNTAALVRNPDSKTTEALGDLYANKATQSTVEAGRLEDSVLTNRFATPTIWISASRFKASGQGTPDGGSPMNNLVDCWRLDGAGTTDEGVVTTFELPRAWATFDIVAVGSQTTAGSGAVRLVGQWSNRGEGENVVTGTTTGTAGVVTASAEHVEQTIPLRTGLANDPAKPHILRVYRTPSHASDTLAADWALIGVRLIAKTWVEFVPELPEPPDDLTGQAFTQADNANLAGLRVAHNAMPPDSDIDDGTYKYYPGTDYATMNSDFVDSTWTLGSKWYFLWASRFNYDDAHNKKPNPTPAPGFRIPDTSSGRECRTTFTTRARAEAATQCMIRHVIGMSAGAVEAPWLAVGGVAGDLIPEQTLRDNRETYFTTPFTYGSITYLVTVDKVILPTSKLADGPNPSNTRGIQLDFEVQDKRTEAETEAFFTAITADIHGQGYELSVYNNPLNAAGPPRGGLGPTSIPAIFDMVDEFGILLWYKNAEGSVAASYANQIAMLGAMTTADWAKVNVVFQLGTASEGTTLADAEWLYDKLHEPGTDHPTLVQFWRSLEQLGGSRSRLVNQKIEMICFGTITP